MQIQHSIRAAHARITHSRTWTCTSGNFVTNRSLALLQKGQYDFEKITTLFSAIVCCPFTLSDEFSPAHELDAHINEILDGHFL